MIDGHLTEINVTSPTGLRAIKRLGGPDLAAAIWDAIEAKRRAGPEPRNDARSASAVETRRDGPRRAAACRRSAAAASTPGPDGRARARNRRRRGVPQGRRSSFSAAALEEGRAEARRALEDGGRGLACAARLSDLEDEIIRAHARHGGRRPSATGAAGARRRSSRSAATAAACWRPGSDIDLLFLLADEPDAEAQKIVETMLYVLWDLKQKVGHATRTVEECLRQAKADMTIRTSLLEARLHPRRRALFETLRERFDKEIVARTRARIRRRQARRTRCARSSAPASRAMSSSPTSRRARAACAISTRCSGSPNMSTACATPRDLVAAGLFSQREFALFRRCEEFLWSVRCHLHFLTGRPEERLSFDLQRPIAERLGYAARAGQSDVERFMKHYFLIAKDVGDLTAIVCAALEERQAKPTQAFDRFVGRLRRRPSASPTPRISASTYDRISVVRADAFDRDPVNLIRLFWLVDRSSLAMPP